ncbi:MAG: peptide chain release factor 2 [Verrucomicrobia bacterium]|nr:MAG: peptide chain release factor 2 [Verrucomicrobiota bacterium]
MAAVTYAALFQPTANQRDSFLQPCSLPRPVPTSKKSRNAPVSCGGFFNVDRKRHEIEALEAQMAQEGFWDNQNAARDVINRANQLKKLVNGIVDFQKKVEDAEVMADLLDEEGVQENSPEAQEFDATVLALRDVLDELEIQSFLTEPHDHCNAILSIHAGAGGTESCDWADMLLRMYTRWAERRGWEVDIQEIAPGEEAGITRATMLLKGPNAYGFAKAERGVHRLVRISPFDANKRRHTSFCAVDVIAEIEDDTEIEIKDEDIKIETFRSSGKGGQHTQKNDTAVRITHLPTGIVSACQNERSQAKNKEQAMKILKARIWEKKQDEKRSEQEKYYGEKGEIGWGNQIRSYVFQPYQMVKDLRTGVETGNIQAVMDGDLDRFVHGWLRAGCPRQRSKEIAIEE